MYNTCKKSNCNCGSNNHSNKRILATIADIRATIAILNAKINEALQEINFADFQDITDRGNITDNYITFKNILSELSPKDLIKIYNSLTLVQENEVAKILFNTYIDKLEPTSIELSKDGINLNVEDILSLAVTKDQATFGTKVSGLDAVAQDDYVTLKQSTDFLNEGLETKVDKIENKSLVDNTLINKLSQDYTKAEIDQQFNDVRNFANSSRINLNGSTILPVPPRRPDNTVIEDAWARLAQNVTYTQAGGSPLTGIDGHETIAEWNNEDDEWVLVDMGELPKTSVIPNLDTKSDTEALAASQGVVLANKIGLPLILIDKKIDETVDDFIWTGSVRNLIFNVKVEGVITAINIWGKTSGNIYIGAYKKSGSNIYRTRWALVTITTGLNTITDFLLEEDEYFGILMNTSTYLGRVGYLLGDTYYERYSFTSTVTDTPVALPSPTNNARYGIQLIQINPNSLLNQIDKKLDKSGLGYVFDKGGENVFDDVTIVDSYLINNTGAKQNVTGWKMAVIDVDASKLNIGGYKFNSRPGFASYYRFEDASGNLISFSSFMSGAEWSTAIPNSATKFYVTIKNPSEGDDVYQDAFLTFDVLVDKIDGKKIAGTGGSGGNSFNQSLNTYDSPKFAGLEVDALKINGLPVGDSGVTEGNMYLEDDGNGNYTVKVKGV